MFLKTTDDYYLDLVIQAMRALGYSFSIRIKGEKKDMSTWIQSLPEVMYEIALERKWLDDSGMSHKVVRTIEMPTLLQAVNSILYLEAQSSIPILKLIDDQYKVYLDTKYEKPGREK